MHRDIFIHMKTYKETCTQTGKKKKKVKSHTHTQSYQLYTTQPVATKATTPMISNIKYILLTSNS